MTECSHSKLFIKNPVEEEYQKWFSRLQESSDFWIDTGGRTRLKRRGAEGVEPLLLVAWPRPDHTSYSYENEMGIPFLSSSFISFSCNSWFLDVNRFRVHTQSGNREGIPLLPRFSYSALLPFFSNSLSPDLFMDVHWAKAQRILRGIALTFVFVLRNLDHSFSTISPTVR